MADGGQPKVGAAFFYGAILKSAVAHEPTAQLWEAIHSAATAAGVGLPSDIFSQVNQLRASAASLAYSSDRLNRAPAGEAITGRLIGQPIYARPPASMEALAQFEARFELITQSPTGTDTQWVRIVYGADLPDTVGGLQDDLALYAADLAESYSTALVGVGRVMLNAI